MQLDMFEAASADREFVRVELFDRNMVINNVELLGDFLQDAIDFYCDMFTPADMVVRMISGEFQTWVLSDAHDAPFAMILTEFIRFPVNNIFRFSLCAGDMGSLSRILDARILIEDYGRQLGADIIEVAGRRGWERVLPDYTPAAVILRKPVHRTT